MKKLLLSTLTFIFTLPAFSQFFEGFENTTGITGPLPATWTLGSGNWTVCERNTSATVGTSQSWGINAFAGGLQYQGANCASVSREDIGEGNTSEDYLITPAVNISSINAELHFYTRMFTSGDQGTKYRIMIAPAIHGVVIPSDINSYSAVVEWTENELINPVNYNQWTEKIVDLSAYAGLGIDVYIAFVRVFTQTDGNISGDRWLIDNVSLLEESTNPCNFYSSASYLSPTSVQLNWVSTSTEPVEAMILPCDDPMPTSTDNGIILNNNPHQFTNLLPNACYKVYIKNPCSQNDNWTRLNINANLAYIRLYAFVDTNNNGIMDGGENYFTNGYFSSVTNNSGGSHYLSSYGYYGFIPSSINDTFDFQYQINTPFYAACATSTSFNFNDVHASYQPQTFYVPIILSSNCFDYNVTLSGSTPPRPGMTNPDYLSIYNYGYNNNSTGTLTYTKAPNVSIVSVTPSAGIVFTPTGFTYSFSGLIPYPYYKIFTIITSTPPIPTVNLGDILTSSASILFTPADSNPLNDSTTLSETVVASYDPNDIKESHGPQIQFNQFDQNDYLTYTIRFQNTGNANAIRVRVDNILDSRIDENSITMIGARHGYIMVRSGNTISWEFNNIQLPPASVNEDLSNGFITFKVKLKPGFAIGDIIPATASIYFDSNPAVITETFNTQFVEQLANPTFDSASISLYPNPAKSTVQITQTGNDDIKQVVFYDVTGKLVKRVSNFISQAPIDISALEKGIYFVEITAAEDIKTIKKLIIQ